MDGHCTVGVLRDGKKPAKGERERKRERERERRKHKRRKRTPCSCNFNNHTKEVNKPCYKDMLKQFTLAYLACKQSLST